MLWIVVQWRRMIRGIGATEAVTVMLRDECELYVSAVGSPR